MPGTAQARETERADTAGEATEAAIAVRGLTKSFGDVRALDGVDFEAAPGTVFGLLGPNGAGKTTAVRVLSTLLKPDSGSARVAGDRRAAPAHVAGVGLEHAERDPHRGRLAGAVGADEADDFACGDVEREAIERHRLSVASRHVAQLQHFGPLPRSPGGNTTQKSERTPRRRPIVSATRRVVRST